MERFVFYPSFPAANKSSLKEAKDNPAPKRNESSQTAEEESEMVIIHYKDEHGNWIAGK